MPTNEPISPGSGVLEDGRLVLKEPAALPGVLDLLIVGGGPFGTAAAFRAKEKGLTALVIDHDDILKRIRDYAKDKLILPDYGGGDQMQFPDGGPLIKALQFGPIDKDDLCAAWKALYRQHSVPAQIGVELIGLDREGAIWRATAMNHNLRREVVLRAKHVVVGVGRGVPRQLEIPGDLSGLSFALSDASRFVGPPVCVIGGGTSAAEAVIAVSNAKTKASDPTAVYWSNRGQKMPKVSQALAGAFFEAFVSNGNVRYLPSSEPVAVVGEGNAACLAIRAERVELAGQPTSVTHLEFLKSATIACIGEDIPEKLLNRIGVPMAITEAGKKRIFVTPVLETRQPDVYLAGDLLSPIYLEGSDFEDPAGHREVRRRGNIKAAMRDGVLVAEVVAQKLQGRTNIHVTLFPKSAEDPDDTRSMETVRGISPLPMPVTACRLVSLLPTGVESTEYPLKRDGVTTIGRRGTDVEFPLDDLVSEKHAEFTPTPGSYTVNDCGSMRGIYLQPAPDRAVPIQTPTMVMAGKQWFMVGEEGRAELAHFDPSGQLAKRYDLQEGTTIVGRESPGISVATGDRALSRRHFSLSRKGTAILLRDLGSANGTLVKIDVATPLVNGDRLLLGQQTLRFVEERLESTPRPDVRFDTTSARKTAKRQAELAEQAKATAARAQPEKAPASTDPSVEFVGRAGSIACTKAEVICDIAKRSGVKLDADCHQGACGMDPIQIISGAEFLSPMGRSEKDTLEDLCSLDPKSHRLACMVRVTGPAKVKIVPQR